MTYKDKSVTENPKNEEKFKSVLGDIMVDEHGIEREEYKGEEHWNKIEAHMEAKELFKGFLPWEHVDKITKVDEHLEYPHVDIHLDKAEEEDDWEEKKVQIFFKKDSPRGYDEIDKFLAHIKRAWNAYLQKHTPTTLKYSYDHDTHVLEPEDDVQRGKGQSQDEKSDAEDEDEDKEESGEDRNEDEVEEDTAEEESEEAEKQKKEGEGGYSNMVDNILEKIG
ncbi:MAG: hypothetical protein SVV03_01185 [Candidatus Nanohaloarchaea archaeon]|nr:hypothetical protein [Candidatus Nanohaloarchaea archaeon]